MAFHRTKGLVSVVVPLYNAKPHIQQCLDSLGRQSYRPLEIIVIDDGSRDGSVREVQHWRQHQRWLSRHRTCVIRLKRNSGYAAAITTGMFLARGEFIALQDADDYSDPKRISTQVAFLRAHPDIGLLGTDYHMVRGGKITSSHQRWLRFGWPQVRQVYARGGHCVSVGTVMLRGHLFDQFGGTTRRLNGAEDYELVANYLDHGVKIDNLKQPLYYYRRHANQRSNAFYGTNR